MSRIRVGAVSYLNTKPLVEGLEEISDRIELIYDLPSRLADRLKNGLLDVALVPVIEVASPQYTVVSDACIACRGEVWSVKLMCRDPEMRIERVALDEGSRTSSALARILLAQKYDLHPDFEPLKISADWRECEADAVLIIGDRAMKAADPRFPHELDLGLAWHRWTGLSFVFAVWAARGPITADPLQLTEVGRWLSAARDRGMANAMEIAHREAAAYGLTPRECCDYFSRHLHFTLGPRERMGLEMYYRYAARMHLVPRAGQPQFLTPTPVS